METRYNGSPFKQIVLCCVYCHPRTKGPIVITATSLMSISILVCKKKTEDDCAIEFFHKRISSAQANSILMILCVIFRRSHYFLCDVWHTAIAWLYPEIARLHQHRFTIYLRFLCAKNNDYCTIAITFKRISCI